MPSDISRIPACELTTHQAPALMVSHIVELGDTGGVVRVEAGKGLDALQQIEACAQAIAVLVGGRHYQQQDDLMRKPTAGMLIGASQIVSQGPLPANVAALISATQQHVLGAMQLWQVTLADEAGAVLLSGQLNIVQGAVPEQGGS